MGFVIVTLLHEKSWKKIGRRFLLPAEFLFPKSATKLHCFHQKATVNVASKAAKRLNSQALRKIGNFKKINEMLKSAQRTT